MEEAIKYKNVIREYFWEYRKRNQVLRSIFYTILFGSWFSPFALSTEKYQYDIYNEKGIICQMDANGNLVQDYYDAYEPDLDSDMESVQIGMWMKEGDETQDADDEDMIVSNEIY